MQEQRVKLPQFVVDSELSRTFREQWPDHLCTASKSVVFNWSDVCFFDDYTLLKLIFHQRQLRSLGSRVSNRGFAQRYTNANKQAVLRQLWTVGMPELTASDHVIGSEHLKDALRDEAELLESDPLLGMQSPGAVTAVVPLLCCHDRKHFAAGSREEKQLDSFIRTCLRPSGPGSLAWDLVETREFRHLMLQQLRRNVQEHSRPEGGAAIGLAIVRVWTCRSLSDEWRLAEDMKAQLLRVWSQAPVPSILRTLDTDRGIVQMSVVDDGAGIPCRLGTVHEGLLCEITQQELFGAEERLRYRDVDFDRRFVEPASWLDKKARLIAFAMDELGTSKPDRAPEVKGLQYMRERAAIAMGGELVIESDGASVGHVTRDRCYGQTRRVQLNWCRSGGTGVCLAVPANPVESVVGTRRRIPCDANLGSSTGTGASAERIRVRDHLITRSTSGTTAGPGPHDIVVCAKEILDAIGLSEAEDDVTQLRRKGLLIVDWGELCDSKSVFHYLLVEIAKGLADAEPRSMRPFVFANLPKGLCVLLEKAISKYSKLNNPTPICAFTTEQREPFWLGLDGENCIPQEMRRQVSCGISRKITDHWENRTEAFYRDCLTRLLTSTRPVFPSDTSVLHSVRRENHLAIQQSSAFTLLNALIRRCALFREGKWRSADGEMAYTRPFQPVFRLGEIVSEVRKLFLDEFCDVFKKPPVCFIPSGTKEGVRLPHSNKVVARYFRSDALVDSSISTEITQELTAIALGIAEQIPGGRIDCVVTCTSPLHWFVHRIVDGLAECGISCSHYVFPSYEEIPALIEDVGIRSGETVLVFTDVIASGQTAYRMADSLVNHFGVRIAGLVALADIRTAEDRTSGPDLDKVYGQTIVCLYNEAEPNRQDLKPTYYVHPETVVPKRIAQTSPMDEFFERNYSGTGPLVEMHAYFCSAKRTLDLMTSLGAVRFGHFQHGSHHSEIFVDVEKVLACRDYRNLMVTALFRYIITHDIRLVLYPSHSSAYMLVDDLKQRFVASESSVEFAMACRTFRGTRGTNYALTRFSPHTDLGWRRFSRSAVLILDDAVCSGATVESIMAELARIDRNYYDGQTNPSPDAAESEFSVHVVAFLNRLPRVTGDFWGGLSRVVAGRVQFSTFIKMPLSADSAELCPQCRLEKRLGHVRDSATHCLYAKEFLSWWISRSAVVSSHERRHSYNQQRGHFSSEESLRLAGYLSAIERNAYPYVCESLFDKPGRPSEEESRAVRVHVRSRAAFLHDLLPGVDKSKDVVADLCKELGSLIDMILDDNGYLRSQEDALGILQVLTIRYLRTPPREDEVIQVVGCLLSKFAPSFGNRLLMGGVACVLDSSLAWFKTPSRKEWKNLRHALHGILCEGDSSAKLCGDTRWVIDWLDVYLADDGEGVSSFGKAVQILARYAQKGRMYHIYGRSELDQLYCEIQRPTPAASGCGAPEVVRRVLASCDQFSEMLVAARVLRSRSALAEAELSNLQKDTAACVEKMRELCEYFQSNKHNDQAVSDTYPAICDLFRNAYLLWFNRDGKVKAIEIIGSFLPSLAATVKSTSAAFLASGSTQNTFKLDYTSLDAHQDLKVLVDPAILKTAIGQILDNIARLAEADKDRQVCWTVEEIRGSVHGASSSRIELVASNTGTPQPNVHKLKLRGLGDVGESLNEYGGDLEVLEPTSPWTFQVAIRLQRWTEVES